MRTRVRSSHHPVVLSAALLLAAATASAVEIEWVSVGDPGNACDPQTQGCFGAVAYSFRIAKYEITNAQYAEFLSAVASAAVLPPGAADPNELYNEDMDGSPHGGIQRSGNGILTDYAYTVKSGFEDKPVTFVSFYDAIRFANWLHNEQLSGAQGASTTEDGAYSITAPGVSGNSITRNSEATVFLPSEDEWYKAAYYDGAGPVYRDYPAGSDTQTACIAPTSIPNSANCEAAVGSVTDIGTYDGSSSPSGVFDLGGNVWEWHDTILDSLRTSRGGSWLNDQLTLEASIRAAGSPSGEFSNQGIRVASPLPEPGGALGLAASLAFLLWLEARRHGRGPRP